MSAGVAASTCARRGAEELCEVVALAVVQVEREDLARVAAGRGSGRRSGGQRQKLDEKHHGKEGRNGRGEYLGPVQSTP